jgi:hypothetical protein
MFYLMRRVGDIDRNVNGAHTKAGNVEQHGLDGFLDLNGDPVSRLDTAPRQGRSHPRGIRAQCPIGERAPFRGSDE